MVISILAKNVWTNKYAAPEDLVQTMLDSSLRGLGGAGFPTGRKWTVCTGLSPDHGLMAVNGDEGEPGTFKDRFYLETNPHQFLEGMLIAAWVVEAETVFICIMRDEYPAAREILIKRNCCEKLEQARATARTTKIELRRVALGRISAVKNRR